MRNLFQRIPFVKGFDPVSYAKEADSAKIIKELVPVLQEILNRSAD